MSHQARHARRGPNTASARTPDGQASGRSARALLLALMALVAGIVVLVHAPVLSAGALALDDQEYLTNNALVQHPGWASAGRFLGEVTAPSSVRGYYQPVPMISLMLDDALGGHPDDLRVFHITNLILHVANTALIMALVYALVGGPWIAALAGLLFGLHPMTVEPVALIGERKTLLAAFFALCTLLLYVRYTRKPSRLLYGCCLATCALAFLSKPSATPLPLVLLLFDFWPLRRLSLRSAMEKIPFLVMANVSVLITAISQRHFEASPSHPFTMLQTVLLACHNLVFYPLKMIWPVHLSPFYAFPHDVSFSNLILLAAVAVTVTTTVLLIWSLRYTRALLVGWMCFFLFLLPTLTHKGYSECVAWDRYAYLPSVGLLLALAWLVRRFASGGTRRNWRYVGVTAATIALSAGLALASRAQLCRWQTTDELYTYMVQLAPDEPVPHYNLGVTLAEEGKLVEAIQQYQQARRLKPDLEDLDNNLGNALAQLGRFDEAIGPLEHAGQLKPRDDKPCNNLANVLCRQGKVDQAIAKYTQALELNPRCAHAHNNLAIALARQGKPAEAVEHFTEAVRLAPDNPDFRKNLTRARQNRATCSSQAP